MRLALRFLAAVVPLLVLTGCDEGWFGDSDRFREDFHYSYPLESGGRFSIENLNGSIEINVWDQNTVEINGTKYAPTEQTLKDIKIDVSAQPTSVSVRTVAAYNFRNGGAKYSIRVPRRVQLDRVVSTNGGIRVYDVEGVAHLKSTNGGIRVSRVKGELDARTTNGGIEAIGQAGDAILHTTNGGIQVDMENGTLEAGTSNGGIDARLAKGDPSKPVRLESTNGHIEVSMDGPRELRASTSNSSIEVRMPPAGAKIRARTSNSAIQTDFDELSRSMTSKHSLDGLIAGGGPLIDLSTSNGHIRLLRR
jgi:DUF4097 and DUF4098 domain-containing protein YvlB